MESWILEITVIFRFEISLFLNLDNYILQFLQIIHILSSSNNNLNITLIPRFTFVWSFNKPSELISKNAQNYKGYNPNFFPTLIPNPQATILVFYISKSIPTLDQGNNLPEMLQPNTSVFHILWKFSVIET